MSDRSYGFFRSLNVRTCLAAALKDKENQGGDQAIEYMAQKAHPLGLADDEDHLGHTE